MEQWQRSLEIHMRNLLDSIPDLVQHAVAAALQQQASAASRQYASHRRTSAASRQHTPAALSGDVPPSALSKREIPKRKKRQMLQNAKYALARPISRSCSIAAQEITSRIDFEEDCKEHYIPINGFQRGVLSVGSALVSLFDPRRGDMIACLGELTGEESGKYMLKKMEASAEGSEILRRRPRINSKSVDLEKLKSYPEGTLGKAYSNFLVNNNVTPDSRPMVQFVQDVNIAYAIQRYREVHDLIHTTLEMPTHMLGEVTVKWVEAIQTLLPMCIGGAVFGATRLRPKHRDLYRKYYLPWAIQTGKHSKFLMNVYFEKRWDQPLVDLHQELNIHSLLQADKNKTVVQA